MMSPTREVPQLIQGIYEIVRRLEELFPGRPFTPDGHLVGSLGEVIAKYRYDLELLDCSTECHDATAPGGIMVQIKATQGRAIALRHEPQHLIVLKLGRDGEFCEAYNGPGALPWSQAGAMQKNGQRSISVTRLTALMRDVPEAQQIQPTTESPLTPCPRIEDLTNT